jgi:uncharacterized protein (AIM24 family)
MLLGGSGFFIDTFNAETNEGIVWLHGYGNVFEVTLHPGNNLKRAAHVSQTGPPGRALASSNHKAFLN